jgi:hypothetical protein
MGNLSISRNKLCTAAKEHFFLSGEKYKILKVIFKTSSFETLKKN